jgi:hypothetical protein
VVGIGGCSEVEVMSQMLALVVSRVVVGNVAHIVGLFDLLQLFFVGVLVVDL